MKTNNPYISILVVVRCDDWGGKSLIPRYQGMINYLYRCQKKYPNLFELCLCEYNPVKKPIFRKIIQIPYDMKYKFWIISKEIHKKLNLQKDFNAIFPLNFMIQKCCGEFILPTSQDFYFSENLLNYLYKRKLDKKKFYRIDKVDFHNKDPEKLSKKNQKIIDNYVKKNAKQIHIRHDYRFKKITYSLEKNMEIDDWPRSKKNLFDNYSKNDEIIYCREKYNNFYYKIHNRLSIWNFIEKILNNKQIPTFIKNFINSLKLSYMKGLHTNGAGDFILAHRDSYIKIRGYYENENQMHLDTFIVAQLASSGLRQAIFTGRKLLYNTYHKRSEIDQKLHLKTDWSKTYSFFEKILNGKINFKLNNNTWGLKKHFGNIEIEK